VSHAQCDKRNCVPVKEKEKIKISYILNRVINVKKPHGIAIRCALLKSRMFRDIKRGRNSMSENGDSDTCQRQEDGTAEPIRKEVSRRGR